MDTQKIRYGLYIAIVIVALLLWGKWNAANMPEITTNHATQQTAASTSSQPVIPTTAPSVHHTATQTTAPTTVSHQPITIKTDVLSLAIDPVGGTITKAALLKYPEALQNKSPIVLFSDSPADYYVASLGFDTTALASPLVFSSPKQHYDINHQRQLIITLTAEQHGLTIIRRYTLLANSYQIQISQKIINQSGQTIKGRFYAQLTRTPPGKHSKLDLIHAYTTYTGAAISTQNDHYQKVSFDDMSSSPINLHTQGGWIAMLQHYFISAWAPPAKQQNQFYSQVSGNHHTIAMAYPEKTIMPGKTLSQSASLYIGPAIAKNLNQVAPYLGKTIDYGWFWFISIWIFALMSWIFQYVGNWGFAIILTTLVIKCVFYPLSAKSYRSMAKMRELGPRVKQLKARFGDDRQSLSKATMELYRKEKVNPLGGCLPMLIQFPVFVGLYWVLMESVELRQAPFMLWIHDLSQQDPYYILPILMGGSMFLQQRLNPAPADPMQAKVMMLLPVFFTVIFLHLPSGLVLYWLVNNLVSILQQWWVMHRYMQASQKKKRATR